VLALTARVCIAQTTEEAVLLSYIQVWNTGDLDRLESLVTADFRRNAGPSESCESIEELKKVISGVRATFDHLELRVDDQMVENDQGALRGEFYGVHRGVNRVVSFPIMSMFRFREGRIAEEWILGNNFLSLVGLGYELVPPGFTIVDPGAVSGELEEAEEPASPSLEGGE
jgi:hypothetical protein